MRKYVFLLLFFLMTALCLSQKIRVVYDQSVDFSQLRSFVWAEQSSESEELTSTMISNFEIFNKRVKDAVKHELMKKGLVYTSNKEDADLILSYYVTLDMKSTTQHIDPGGPLYNTRFDPTWAVSTLEGTLILNILDAKTNKRAWRGTATEAVKKKDQEKRIKKTIKKLLKKFPPKGKK